MNSSQHKAALQPWRQLINNYYCYTTATQGWNKPRFFEKNVLGLVHNDTTARENSTGYRMFFLGHNFVSSLICTLKIKKNNLNLNT